MKQVCGRVVAYIVLYLGIVFGICVLQFTKGQTFSISLGAMTVTGRQERTQAGELLPLLPLHIVSNGLDLYISEQNPVYSVDEADAVVPLRIVSYRFHEKEARFSVKCSDGVVISFFCERRGHVDSFAVEATIPNGIKKIALPWKITQNAGFERVNGKMFVRFGKNHYAFVGGFSFNTDEHAQKLSETPHVVLEKRAPAAYYKTYVPLSGFDISAIPSMAYASVEAYNEALKTFSSAILRAGSYVPSSNKYNEKTMIAYIAEMGQCGQFARALTEAPAQTFLRSVRTYLSNPFFGNVQETHAGLAADDAKKREQYAALLAEGSLAIFEHNDIIPFLTDRGTEGAIEELFHLIETVDALKLTARQAVGVLGVWLDCLHYYPDRKTLFEDVLPQCEKRITESLVLIDEELYLSNDGTYIDTLSSLSCARILMKYGSARSPVWQPVARMLITSLLRYSGAAAGLPIGFTVSGDKTTEREITADDSSMLDAGILYPLVVPNNSWYPHAQSLALQAEAGVWAWTCAQSIEVLKNTTKELAFRVRFPEGQSHYLTLHGIKPFYRIEMYGIPFRSDARFEMYNSSGYAYDAENKILYVKMRHKSEYEVIRLSLGAAPYRAPSAPAIRPANSSNVQSAVSPQMSEQTAPEYEEEPAVFPTVEESR